MFTLARTTISTFQDFGFLLPTVHWMMCRSMPGLPVDAIRDRAERLMTDW